MNAQAIQILFLKDLFLSRWPLFGYLLGGLASCGVLCLPGETMGFIGFILMVTVAIASGIHLIATLLLAESIDHTRVFVLSLPVSLLEYSLAKIAVVLTAFLIPWGAMLAFLTICTLIVPGAKAGAVPVLATLFLFLLATFAVQVVTAVITESVGWTVCVLVLCNVLFNLFAKAVLGHPTVLAARELDTISWPPVLLQSLAGEVLVIAVALGAALYFQSRKRDLI